VVIWCPRPKGGQSHHTK